MRIVVLGGKAHSLLNFRGNLIQEMMRRGHQVIAMAPDQEPGVCAGLEALGATFCRAPLSRTGMNPLADLVGILRLARTFRRLKPELILAYTTKPVTFGILSAWLARIPTRCAMITGRGTPLMGNKGGLFRRAMTFLYRLSLGRTQGVIFQNHDDLAFFSEEGMLPPGLRHTVVNGSGVDVAHFPLTPLPQGPPVFLYLGRMIKDKGIQEYLGGCRCLFEAGIPARFLAVGPLDSNPSALTAAQLAEGCRISGVEYLGEAADVRPFLAQIHVLILPSRGEGTPRSVLEAMAMGRAIITTDAPGCRATVEDGVNGFLVPVGDSKALAHAMMRLAKEPELIAQFGQASRGVAETKYEVGKVTAAVLAFLGIQDLPG